MIKSKSLVAAFIGLCLVAVFLPENDLERRFLVGYPTIFTTEVSCSDSCTNDVKISSTQAFLF